jgi:integrase
MGRAIKVGPYTAWRDGRPRFIPGARERAMGFKGQDLKHDDGRWYTMDEAHGFAVARHQEIQQQRRSGRKLKAPPVARGRAVQDLWDAFTASNEYKGNAEKKIKGLAASTQEAYKKYVRPLQAEPIWLGPVAALDPIILKALHTKITNERGLSMANASLAALGSALSWGRLHGWLPRVNGRIVDSPYSRLKLPSPPVRLRVATVVELTALITAADHTVAPLAGHKTLTLSCVGDAIALGFYSGQRGKDIRELVDDGVVGQRMRLKQSKTGAIVSVPQAPLLTKRIAAGRARRNARDFKVVHNNIVVNERDGAPYANARQLRDDFKLVRSQAIEGVADAAATETRNAALRTEGRDIPNEPVWLVAPCTSLKDFTFADLRDTAVTWLARAGCTPAEIASITGHEPDTINKILKHYLLIDEHLADNAIRKLVERMEREGLAV